MSYKIEKRNGVDVLFENMPDGSEWCRPAGIVEVELYDEVQALTARLEAAEDMIKRELYDDMLAALERCYKHIKNDMTICGIVDEAKYVIDRAKRLEGKP